MAKSTVRKSKSPSEAQSSTSNSNSLKAKLFQNGRSQAVRLPKDYRFEGSEIGIGRMGSAVVLYPLDDPWALFFEGAEELANADLPDLKRSQDQSARKFPK